MHDSSLSSLCNVYMSSALSISYCLLCVYVDTQTYHNFPVKTMTSKGVSSALSYMCVNNAIYINANAF